MNIPTVTSPVLLMKHEWLSFSNVITGGLPEGLNLAACPAMAAIMPALSVDTLPLARN